MPCSRVLVLLWGIGVHVACDTAPTALRGVHRDVRVLEQFLRRLTVLGKDRDPDAGAHADNRPIDVALLRDALGKLGGELETDASSLTSRMRTRNSSPPRRPTLSPPRM